MANTEAEYEQDLQNIRNAIYGKDVREAMADALDYVHDTSSISGLNLKMDKANPTGTGYISINGRSSSTPGAKSVSLGNNCWAGGQNSVAMGINCDAHYDTSVAIGYSVSSDAAAQAVFGKCNAVDEAAIFIVGNGSDSSNKANAFVVKRNGAIHAKNDLVLFTTDCKISMMREPYTTAGMYSVTLGQYNTASNTHAMAIGYQNAATAEESFAGGYVCQANHTQSFAFGLSLRTGRNRQSVIGEYNDTDSDALFVVGNGTDDDNRSNAFVVKKNGSINANGSKFAFGTGVTNSSGSDVNQFVIGTYNSEFAEDSDDPNKDALFIIGNGTSTSTSEAFKVFKNGSIVSGIGTFAQGPNQFIVGKYINNQRYDFSSSLFVVGAGTSHSNRLNAFEVGSDGKVRLYSPIIKCGDNSYDISDVVNIDNKLDKELENPITISGDPYTNVVSVLNALANRMSTLEDIYIAVAIVTGNDELNPYISSAETYEDIDMVFGARKTVILQVLYGTDLSQNKIHIARMIERTGDAFRSYIFECDSKDLSKKIRYTVNTVNKTISGSYVT